jgi:hypothetical protein
MTLMPSACLKSKKINIMHIARHVFPKQTLFRKYIAILQFSAPQASLKETLKTYPFYVFDLSP